MPVVKLTATRCDFLKHNPKDGDRTRYADSVHKGLALIVFKSGAKSWSYRTKGTNYGLGSFPAVGLADARKAAAKIDDRLAHGEDPRDDKSPVHVDDMRVEVAFERWLDHCRGDGRKAHTLVNRRSLFNNHLRPAWKGRRVDRLTHTEVEFLIGAVEQRGQRWTALALRKMLPGFFGWCVVSGYFGLSRNARERSPLFGGYSSKAKRPAARSRAVGIDVKGNPDPRELAIVWEAMTRLVDQGEPFARLPQLLLLSAQRRGEVLDMPLDEVDAAGVWVVGSLRGGTKNGKVHELRLPPLARSILSAQIAEATAKGYRRTFTVDGDRVSHPVLFPPANLVHLFVRKLDAMVALVADEHGVEVRPFVLHDLRRGHRSMLSVLGIRREVAELVLNHTRQGEVGTYEHAALNAEKAAALVAFEDHLLKASGGNVIPFEQRAG